LPEVDVFLSYSRSDREAARRFADGLAGEGLTVWWDAALRAGETFDEVIENALKAAKSVIVLWSPRSVTSRWVRAEATLADRRNKLVPVIIEQCDRPIIFELTHTTDLSGWDGTVSDPAWRSMIKDVQQLVDHASAAAAPKPPAAERAAPSGNGRQFERHDRAASDRNPPRKLDNLIFTRVGSGAARNGANGHDSDLDTDDSTRFYTSSSGYGLDQFHCLELTIGERIEKRFVVSPTGLRIGRAAPADVVLADSRVSRTHCIVELKDDELRVSDLSSTNGTFVDGERIAGSGALPVGSVLKVGNVSFKHQLRTSADV
jgi:TIR domain/Inner membrane component of T3SS, cytoplasmic domain